MISPLQLTRGKNLSEYKKFRREFHDLIRAYATQIDEIRKENSDYTVEGNFYIESIYSKGLELLLVEASQDEKTFVPITKLTEVTGIQPSQSAWETALTRHIRATTVIPENAASILPTIEKKTGLRVEDVEAMRDHVSYELTDGGNIERSLTYLVALTREGEFSDGTNRVLKSGCIESLSNGDFVQYDASKKFLPQKAIDLPPFDKDKVQSNAVQWGQKGEFWKIKALNNRVGNIFTENDAKNLGVYFLGGFDISKYDELKKEFSFVDFDDVDKEKIRKAAINYLTKNPQHYNRISSINERTQSLITATPIELKDIVSTYFEKDWSRQDPRHFAEALHQQLDPVQIQERYGVLLKKYLSKAGKYEDKSEAQQLQKNTSVPLSDEVVSELTRHKRHAEMITILDACQSLGYELGEKIVNDIARSLYIADESDDMKRLSHFKQKPTPHALEEMVKTVRKEPKEKVKWAHTLKSLFSFQVSTARCEEIYRELIDTDEPAYDSISSLRNATNSVPPIDVSEKIVAQSMARYNHGLEERTNTYCIDSLVQSLTHYNNIEISQNQKHTLRSYLAGKARYSIENFAQGLERAKQLYNYSPSFSEDEQKTILDILNRQVAHSSYSSLKKRGYIMDKTKIIAPLIGDDVRQEANQKLTELVTRKSVYQALVYAEATGATPTLSSEQYSDLQNEFKSQEHRFPKYKLRDFNGLMTSWKPQIGGTEQCLA